MAPSTSNPPITRLPLIVRMRCADDGRAALTVGRALDRSVVLASDPGAAAFAGAGWWAASVGLLAAEFQDQTFTAILDCGDAPGLALGALRAGVRDLSLTSSADILARVADMAGQAGARLHQPVTGAIDLRFARDRVARLHQIAAESPTG